MLGRYKLVGGVVLARVMDIIHPTAPSWEEKLKILSSAKAALKVLLQNTHVQMLVI